MANLNEAQLNNYSLEEIIKFADQDNPWVAAIIQKLRDGQGDLFRDLQRAERRASHAEGEFALLKEKLEVHAKSLSQAYENFFEACKSSSLHLCHSVEWRQLKDAIEKTTKFAEPKKKPKPDFGALSLENRHATK